MQKNCKKGKIVIISSPSGGGKTTICRRLLRTNPRWTFSVSYTTRPMRAGEKNGREYWFVEEKEFSRLRRANFFAESAKVHLHHYGTPCKPLKKAIKTGQVILLDVDVQGAASIKGKYPEAISLFILPPSETELKKRLRRRGTETAAQLRVRLHNAIREMGRYNEFDYVIINKDVNKAADAADHMIKSWTVGVTYFGRNKSKAYSVYGK